MEKKDQLLSQINNVLKDCSQVGEQYKGLVNLTKELSDSFKAAVHIISNKLNQHDEMMSDIFKLMQKPGILDKREIKKMKDLENEVKEGYSVLKKTVDLSEPKI